MCMDHSGITKGRGLIEANELCIRCGEPVTPLDHFCPHCGAPLTTFATTAPYESIRAEVDAFTQASNKPRKPIVVIGMWLIFFPSFLLAVFFCGFAVYAVINPGKRMTFGEETVAVVFFLICAGWVWVSGTFLFRTTYNFVRKRSKPEQDDG